MEPTNPLSSLRRRWRVVALTVLVGVVTVFFASPAEPSGSDRPLFGATNRLIYQPTNDPASGGQRASSRGSTNLGTIAALTTGNEVAEKAADKLGYAGSRAALTGRVRAEPSVESSTIDITATSRDRRQADLIADAFSSSLIELLDERGQQRRDQALADINTRLKTLQDGIRRLDAQIATTPLSAQAVPVAQRDALVRQYSVVYEQLEQYSGEPGSISGLTLLRDGEVAPISRGLQPPRTRTGRIALAGLLGTIVGGGLALVLDRLDRGVRNKAMAEAAFGVPLLAEIPPLSLAARKGTPLLTDSRPNSTVAEAYRTLRTALLLMHEQQTDPAGGNGQGVSVTETESPLQVVMVSSPNPSEGKTTTAANLAVTFAEAGRQVLVIDCDFRHPRVHRYLGVQEGAGLSDVLLGGPKAPSLRDVVRPTRIAGVRIVTSGTAVDNPSELFARGHDIVEGARALADIVILDTPPVLVINDAIELSPNTDAVVLVCRSSRTTMEEGARASETLLRLGAPLAGVVVVGSTEAPTNKSSYYYYYYRSEQNVGRGLFGRLRHRRRRPREAVASVARQAPKKSQRGAATSGPKPKAKRAADQAAGARRSSQQPSQKGAQTPTPPARPPAAQVAPTPPAGPPAARVAPPPAAPGEAVAPAEPRASAFDRPTDPAPRRAADPSPAPGAAGPRPAATPRAAGVHGAGAWAPEPASVAPVVEEIEMVDPDAVALSEGAPDDPFRRP